MILDLLIKDEEGETVAKMVLNPKDFKTGSKGFYVNDKLTIGGKRYQAQCQLVEIGSKEAGKEEGKEEKK
jgi:hypothetical protein